jgi:5-methyltetrahydropteroyltriglutamate--homocysteine methyltransferase
MRAGRLPEAAFEAEADESVRRLVAWQEEAGVDVLTDGEQHRDSFLSFVARRLEGVRMMTLAEMLQIVDDKAAFEEILQALDVPTWSISNPTCVGPVARRGPLAADEARFLRGLTDRPIKVALPGPYLLTRAMWVKEAARATYPTKEDLGEDVVRILRAEIADLVEAGVDFVQLDEPVLTELVFTQGRTRTFMCAALAARKDPAEELELAVALVNRVVEGHGATRLGLHVCRGNWSRDERTLLRGSYAPLRDTLDRMHVDQLVLEHATDRAGDLVPFPRHELGLGVVNPRTDRVETAEEIEARVEGALALVPAERLFLNPDCGFGTFSNRPMNSDAVARAKVASMVEAARRLRARLARTEPGS